MCDYSLSHVASRPARVGDILISTRFCNSITRGFAAEGEPEVAVCLLPGTEVAFEKEVRYEHGWSMFRTLRLAQKMARFRQIDLDKPTPITMLWNFPTDKSCSSTICARTSARPFCNCRCRNALRTRQSSGHRICLYSDCHSPRLFSRRPAGGR